MNYLIFIGDLDIDEILISNKFLFGEKRIVIFKYLC